MGNLFQEPVVVVDIKHAWGYHSPRDFETFDENPTFKKYIYLHNGLNVGSIFVSPLAGIIRIVASV